MTTPFAESFVEDAALARLGGLGWQVEHGPEIAVGEPRARGTPQSASLVTGRSSPGAPGS